MFWIGCDSNLPDIDWSDQKITDNSISLKPATMDRSGIVLSGLAASMVFLTLSLTLLLSVSGGSVTRNYLQKRSEVIAADMHKGLGANWTLSDQEKIVDHIILKEKAAMMDPSIYNRTVYIPKMSFYKSKHLMEKLPLFKIIQNMPKGGILHIHDTASGSLDWLIQNATYRDNVYMCVGGEYILLAVFTNPPKEQNCTWKLIKSERQASGNWTQFDTMLKKNISFLSTDPEVDYADNNISWGRFQKYFAQVTQLIFYIPIFKDYIWNALERMQGDNCQYLEFRGGLEGLFDLSGKPKDAEFGLLMINDIFVNFTRDHPDFIGGKIIWTGFRGSSEEVVLEQVKTAVEFRRKYSNFFLGYDLVGDEVLNPLLKYLDALLYPSKLSPPVQLPFFFHAGETNWQNSAIDYNLVDALLLNTTRIGHGFALTKHPYLAQIARNRGVAVEVNPISNQVLRLVDDLRNHPMTSLMSDNFPIVISSDDPGAWEALPLSHDFFLALTAMSGRNTGLSFLKQLAINSLRYSGMTTAEKNKALGIWQGKWEKFIHDTVKQYTL